MGLLFYHGTALYDRAIEAWEHSPWSHVACRAGDDVIEAISAGVIKRPWLRRAGDTLATFVPCALNVGWLLAQVGKPYDWEALACDLLAELLPPGVHLLDTCQGQWDCSRLAAVASGHVDYALRGPVTPADLYRIVTENTKHGLP